MFLCEIFKNSTMSSYRSLLCQIVPVLTRFVFCRNSLKFKYIFSSPETHFRNICGEIAKFCRNNTVERLHRFYKNFFCLPKCLWRRNRFFLGDLVQKFSLLHIFVENETCEYSWRRRPVLNNFSLNTSFFQNFPGTATNLTESFFFSLNFQHLDCFSYSVKVSMFF